MNQKWDFLVFGPLKKNMFLWIWTSDRRVPETSPCSNTCASPRIEEDPRRVPSLRRFSVVQKCVNIHTKEETKMFLWVNKTRRRTTTTTFALGSFISLDLMQW